MVAEVMDQFEDGAITEYECAVKLYNLIWRYVITLPEHSATIQLLAETADKLVPDSWDRSEI